MQTLTPAEIRRELLRYERLGGRLGMAATPAPVSWVLDCQRCGRPRIGRSIDERCCNWRGKYLGRHRRSR